MKVPDEEGGEELLLAFGAVCRNGDRTSGAVTVRGSGEIKRIELESA